MFLQSNYRHLLNIRSDINKQLLESASFGFFNKRKIDDFFKLNGVRLQVCDEHIRGLIAAHVNHDETGQPVKIQRDGKEYFDYIDDYQKDLFEESYNEFLARDITLAF